MKKAVSTKTAPAARATFQVRATEVATGISAPNHQATSATIATIAPNPLEDRLWRAQNLRHSGATEDEIKQYLSQSQTSMRREMPEGIALIGLIPIGVGLAYIIYYRGEADKPIS